MRRIHRHAACAMIGAAVAAGVSAGQAVDASAATRTPGRAAAERFYRQHVDRLSAPNGQGVASRAVTCRASGRRGYVACTVSLLTTDGATCSDPHVRVVYRAARGRGLAVRNERLTCIAPVPSAPAPTPTAPAPTEPSAATADPAAPAYQAAVSVDAAGWVNIGLIADPVGSLTECMQTNNYYGNYTAVNAYFPYASGNGYEYARPWLHLTYRRTGQEQWVQHGDGGWIGP